MKMRALQQLALVAAVVWAASPNARAAIVDLTFTWTGSFYKTGYTDPQPGTGGSTTPGYINARDAIGIYKFTASGDGVSNPFYSVCLSPAGLLDTARHSYNVLSFSQASPGRMPSAWATGPAGELWGINNAAYLWDQYGMKIVGNTDYLGKQNERAAALEFAIWNTLYNSTGYGQVAGNNWIAPTGQMGADVRSFYDAFNAAVLGSLTGPTYDGSILRSVESGAGQDLFMLDTVHATGVTPVPEPSTMIAGSVALLFLGASMFRRQRRTS